MENLKNSDNMSKRQEKEKKSEKLTPEGEQRRKFLKYGAKALAGIGVAYAAANVVNYFAQLDLPFMLIQNPEVIRRKREEEERRREEEEKAEYDRELRSYIDTYGENGDRAAYAVNHLAELRGRKAVPACTVEEVVEFWKGLDQETKDFVGNQLPTATAAVLADELLDAETRGYVEEFPRLAFVHAHTNALFAMDRMILRTQDVISEGKVVAVENLPDEKLVAYATARYTQGRISPDLNYSVGRGILTPLEISKPKFVRDGFRFFAENHGENLNSKSLEYLASVVGQTTAGDVTDQDGDVTRDDRVGGTNIIWFKGYGLSSFPTYAFSKGDRNDNIMTEEDGLSETDDFGLDTMKDMWRKMPDEIKFNCYSDGTFFRPYGGNVENSVVRKLNEFLQQEYGRKTFGPEARAVLEKKLFASQGLPGYNFRIGFKDGYMGGITYPVISNYFTVVTNGNLGLVNDFNTPFVFSPTGKYFLDLDRTYVKLQHPTPAHARIVSIEVYLPHLWHTGILFETIFKKY